MTQRSIIKAVPGDETPASPGIEAFEDDTVENSDAFEEPDDDDLLEDYAEDDSEVVSREWIAPALAIAAIAVWTGFFAWANWAALSTGGTPVQWSGWIVSWAIPVLLVVSLWMLALRNSRHEARRFGEVAHSLSIESAKLEEKLAVVNRELSLAREFLGSQTRDLEYLGRSASERISEHADRLQGLIHDNGEQVEAIARVTGTALENMNRLRDNLPVIANSAKDVSNQIGAAGQTAQSQLDELITGFRRLNEFGTASERQVASLQTRVDEALVAFEAQAEQLGSITEQRFAALRAEGETFRGELDSREVEALAAMRARAAALRAEMGESNSMIEGEIEALFASLQVRLEAMRGEAASVATEVRAGEDVALAKWGEQINAMRERLVKAIEEIRGVDKGAIDFANKKLQALVDEAKKVDARTAERNRKFEDEALKRQARLAEAEEQAVALMQERITALDAAIAERRAAQLEQSEALAREGEALAEKIALLGEVFEKADQQGREASGQVSAGVDALNAKLVESREALDGTDMAVAALTDASVRLLELIQASAHHTREELPVAMATSEERLAGLEARANEVHALLEEARMAGDKAGASMELAGSSARGAMEEIDRFQSAFGENTMAQADSIERLRAGVAALGEENAAVAERARNELQAAIDTLQASAKSALAAIEDEQAERIASLADKVGAQSSEAIERALAEHTEGAIAKLEEATTRSSEAGRETVRQLRDQLAKVNELTGNLENRIKHARERAVDEVDNDFSRRVALITESLNSNAIDIAKALSTEVTDMAWASYLRGDRGIFTRRAVNLVDSTEARDIAELYDADSDFREHVSRYIHDFEAMLRTMLSTRDGHAVSVTLLSSDMGKLYVVLAQALERLRE